MNTIFIGIAGGTGSGKTTLTEHLAQRFGPDISVVHHDNYYKRQDCPFEERCKQNYDHPDAFDTELMVEDLKRLKAGETIHCPVYDYTIHNRTDRTIEIKPTKVVIVEGILIFQNKALRDLLDIKIFVETDADVRILRRALRDQSSARARRVGPGADDAHRSSSERPLCVGPPSSSLPNHGNAFLRSAAIRSCPTGATSVKESRLLHSTRAAPTGTSTR